MQKSQVPADEGKGDEAQEVDGELVVAGGEVPVLLEPVHAPLDDAPLAVRTLVQWGLAVAFDLVAPLRDDRDDLAVGQPSRDRRVAVPLVAGDFPGPVHSAR